MNDRTRQVAKTDVCELKLYARVVMQLWHFGPEVRHRCRITKWRECSASDSVPLTPIPGRGGGCGGGPPHNSRSRTVAGRYVLVCDGCSNEE